MRGKYKNKNSKDNKAIKKINISGGIGYDFTAEDFRKSTKDETGDLELSINSGGGSVYEAFEIYNEMISYRKRNNSKITAVLNGFVASAASYLSMGATERHAYDNSVFMIHNASMPVFGDHRTMRFWSEDLEKTDKVIALAYSKASKKPTNEVLELMSVGQDNNGSYFYGEEIVNSGFATSILESGETLDKDNSITESKMNYVNFNKNIEPIEYDHEKIVAMINTTNSQQALDINKGDKMDKLNELLNDLVNFKTNGDITLMDIAKKLGLETQVITEDQKVNLAGYEAVKKICGDESPVDLINGLLAEKKENAEKVRTATFNELFGSEIHETTKKENTYRTYANTYFGNDELTEEKINAFKEDSIAKKLAAEYADINSDENVIGESVETVKINKSEMKSETVEY